MTTADMRRTAANLAAVFCRTDRCVSAHKAIYDAMVRSRESGYAAGLAEGLESAKRLVPPRSFGQLEKVRWGDVVRAANQV